MSDELQVGKHSFEPYVSQYVHLRRRDGVETRSRCCVRHCFEYANYGHHIEYGDLIVTLDLCDEHHRKACE